MGFFCLILFFIFLCEQQASPCYSPFAQQQTQIQRQTKYNLLFNTHSTSKCSQASFVDYWGSHVKPWQF